LLQAHLENGQQNQKDSWYIQLIINEYTNYFSIADSH